MMRKFIMWNSIFIITDMVANLLTHTPFTLRSVLIEWFWWNAAFCIVIAVGFVSLHLGKQIVSKIKRFFKYFI